MGPPFVFGETRVVLILGAVLIAAGVWAWFARDPPRTLRIAVFALVGAGIAFMLFALILDRLN